MLTKIGNSVFTLFSKKSSYLTSDIIYEGDTEILYGNSNPSFSTVFNSFYRLNSDIEIMVELINFNEVMEENVVGTCEFTLQSIIDTQNKTLTYPFIFNSITLSSSLEVTASYSDIPNEFVSFELSIKEFFSKNRIFFRIYNKQIFGDYNLIYTTDPVTIDEAENSSERVFIPHSWIKGEKIDKEIKIEACKELKKKESKIMATCIIPYEEMTSSLKKEKSEHLLKNNTGGTFILKILKFKITKEYSFINFLLSRLNMQVILAVDLTSSEFNKALFSRIESKQDDDGILDETLELFKETILDFMFELDTNRTLASLALGATLPPLFQSMNTKFSFTLDMLDVDLHSKQNFERVVL